MLVSTTHEVLVVDGVERFDSAAAPVGTCAEAATNPEMPGNVKASTPALTSVDNAPRLTSVPEEDELLPGVASNADVGVPAPFTMLLDAVSKSAGLEVDRDEGLNPARTKVLVGTGGAEVGMPVTLEVVDDGNTPVVAAPAPDITENGQPEALGGAEKAGAATTGCNCFGLGTSVMTPNGAKKMSSLRAGDWVYDGEGNPRLVTAVVQFWQETPVVMYTVTADMLYPVTAHTLTGDHPATSSEDGNTAEANTLTGEHPVFSDRDDRWYQAWQVGLKHETKQNVVQNILLEPRGDILLSNGVKAASLGHCGVPANGEIILYNIKEVMGDQGWKLLATSSCTCTKACACGYGRLTVDVGMSRIGVGGGISIH